MSGTDYHQIRTTEATAPAGCPVDHHFSPLNDDFVLDPYPISSRMREETPIAYAEEMGFVVVSRMADITEVFLNPEVYSSENVQDPVWPLCDEAAAVLANPSFNPVAVMSNRQEPDHGRIRQFTKKGFTNRRNQVLEPYIRRRTEELVGQMIAGGSPADFIASVALPLPGEVVFRFMGFPEEDYPKLKAWCGERLAFSWGHPSPEQQVEIAEKMVAYWEYVQAFTRAKQEEPADDFASELLADHAEHPDLLSYREVESILYGLSFAGHEPVTLLLGNALSNLLSRREDWHALCADPGLIPNALEEVIRFDSPQTGWRRITTQDTTLGGIDLPAGTQVFLNLGAANRDPDEFPDPEVFDIGREKARNHISFGKGNHYCLGVRFAKFEARVVLDVLTQRLPQLQLAGGHDFETFPNISFRGPTRLDVAW